MTVFMLYIEAMQNRPIVIRLRPFISTRTWNQLKTLTKQGVIDAFTTDDNYIAFTPDEIIQLDKWGRYAFKYLVNEWVMAQHEDFIQNRYIPAFKAAINPSMSSYTVRQVYLYTISEGLSEETAQIIHKKAVEIYHGELNNG